ncbi:MAG: Smr/MutS family protein [Thermodesulfobacteriota bacterium]
MVDLEKPDSDVMELPIDGTLDLHTFRPQDAASVAEEYLQACAEKGIFEVKIVHGKGKGTLRRTVHALLERHPLVLEFALDSGPSGWGATVVHLKRRDSKRACQAAGEWDKNG